MRFAPAIAGALLLAGAAIPNTVMAQAHPAKTKLFPVTVVDDHHNRVHIASEPKRIVTLFPGETEILFALGLEARDVGDASYEGAAGIHRNFKPSEWPSRWGKDYPVRSPKITHIGGGCCGTPYSVETIVSLRPDLVIGPYDQEDVQTYQQLKSLGIKVIILDPSTIGGVLHDIQLVGKATGVPNRATTITGGMKKMLKSVESHIKKSSSRPRVYYEIDATNPTQPYTAGPGTFIDQAIKLAGGKNVADRVRTCSGTLCYPQFSLESLVKLNPQVVVLGDSNYGTTKAQVRARAGWTTISAVKTGKIYPFDDDLMSRAGPRVVIGVDRLAHLVHPGAFKK